MCSLFFWQSYVGEKQPYLFFLQLLSDYCLLLHGLLNSNHCPQMYHQSQRSNIPGKLILSTNKKLMITNLIFDIHTLSNSWTIIPLSASIKAPAHSVISSDSLVNRLSSLLVRRQSFFLSDIWKSLSKCLSSTKWETNIPLRARSCLSLSFTVLISENHYPTLNQRLYIDPFFCSKRASIRCYVFTISVPQPHRFS